MCFCGQNPAERRAVRQVEKKLKKLEICVDKK